MLGQSGYVGWKVHLELCRQEAFVFLCVLDCVGGITGGRHRFHQA